MIRSQELPPGAKLLQAELAERFGVSVGVVREALFDLRACGFVEAVDNRGMSVRRLDLDGLEELYELREVHEGLATRRCCGRIKPTDIKCLRQLSKKIYDHARCGEREAGASLDRRFHENIVELAGSEMLAHLVQSHRALGKIAWTPNDPKATYDEHLALLDAIQADRPEQAEQLAREHVRNGLREFRKRFADTGFVGRWIP